MWDNRVRNNGGVIRFAADGAADARVLILGDSFTYGRCGFPAETWREVTFAHPHTLHEELLDGAQPDLFLSVSERFHLDVPDDSGGLSARGWCERKAERSAT